MNNDLVRYASGEVTAVPKADRAVVAEARKIYNETRIAAMKADGTMALAGHIMDGMVALDARRQNLSNGDPVTNAMLAEVQVTAMRKVKQIQEGLFDTWNL